MTSPNRIAPEWAANLVIYELNPKAFTSPDGAGDGSGSGTFASMTEKLPYLADLGINGIWMAGHHVATTHFYGIWSVYACLEPDRLDPSLGTPEDLKTLVATAHTLGLRVFLDVIAHGVLHESPLVAQHPDWFASSSWGMADYDYSNPEFREWWITMWVNYALEYDLDGYRIDVAMVDITVWDEIVSRILQRTGKHITIFPENERYHFSQQDMDGLATDPMRSLFTRDYFGVPRALEAQQMSCHDYGWESLPGNHFAWRGSRAFAAHGGLLTPRIPLFMAGEEFNADPVPLPNLTQGLFGTGGPGGWLYGNCIDWEQLQQPDKAAMLADVKDMLALRRRYPQLLTGDAAKVAIARVPHDGATPYVPFAVGTGGREALMVLANPDSHEIVTTIRVPRAGLGIDPSCSLIVTDAVSGEALTVMADDTLNVRIGPDKTPGGGYRALHVAAE